MSDTERSKEALKKWIDGEEVEYDSGFGWTTLPSVNVTLSTSRYRVKPRPIKVYTRRMLVNRRDYWQLVTLNKETLKAYAGNADPFTTWIRNVSGGNEYRILDSDWVEQEIEVDA